MSEPPQITINPDDLVAKLQLLESKYDSDMARVVEHLLLENHVLHQGQSRGLKRGGICDFSAYPRFLHLLSDDDTIDDR